jgi:hypothetical protein
MVVSKLGQERRSVGRLREGDEAAEEPAAAATSEPPGAAVAPHDGQ